MKFHYGTIELCALATLANLRTLLSSSFRLILSLFFQTQVSPWELFSNILNYLPSLPPFSPTVSPQTSMLDHKQRQKMRIDSRLLQGSLGAVPEEGLHGVQQDSYSHEGSKNVHSGLWVFPLQWGREHKERRRQKASPLVWLLLFFSPGAS